MTTATEGLASPRLGCFADAEAVLAKSLPNYTSRPAQQVLAQTMETLFNDCRAVEDEKGKVTKPGEAIQLLAEAGTGTGKSLAALISAILTEVARGGRVIISTSTIALMNQYIRKDLPFLEKHLPVKFTWAQLKGLSNYACLARLQDATPDQVVNLEALREELGDDEAQHTGDQDDIVTEIDSEHWKFVSTTSDECPGRSSCAFGDRCFGYAAKDKAAEASVVITTAKMLFLDLAATIQAREESPDGTDPGSFIIGKRTVQIIDEAHAAADIAADTLGFELKEGGLRLFANEATSFINIHSGADADAEKIFESIEQSIDRIRTILLDHIEASKKSEDGDDRAPTSVLTVEFVKEHFEIFLALVNRVNELWTLLDRIKIEKGAKDKQETKRKSLQARARSILRAIAKILEAPEIDMVAWPETYEQKLRTGGTVVRWMLKARPIEVGPILRDEMWSKYPTALISATLSVDGDFTYMARTLGLRSARTLNVGTPFDYPNQAMLFHPASTVPRPTGGEERSRWQTYANEVSLKLVRDAGGGAMLLFTSVKDMKAAHALLAPKLEADGYPCYLQNDGMTSQEIATHFRQEEDSVLFGTKTFFTGVDFPGWTNRLVIISKLPFPVPTEPIYAARAEKIRKANPNNKWASLDQLGVPMMALELHQAFGRLIRTVSDVGVVAVLDSRLGTTPYGKRVRKGMPDAPYTTDLDDVAEFFRGWRAVKAS